MSILFRDDRSIEEAVGGGLARFDPTKHPRGRGGKFRDVLGQLEKLSPGESIRVGRHEVTRDDLASFDGKAAFEVRKRGRKGSLLAPAASAAREVTGTRAPGGERPKKRAAQVAEIQKRVKSPAHKFAVSERGKKVRDIRGPRPGTPEAAASRQESAARARARAAELRGQGNEEHARDYDEMAQRFERRSPGGERTATREPEQLAQEIRGPGQMRIRVSDRPPPPHGHREQEGGFREGDRVVLPDGRVGTVRSGSHARGGEQHYLVDTPAGKVGSQAWKDEEIFYEGKHVKRSTALANVRKQAQERYKGTTHEAESVQRAVDAFLNDWWNQDRPGRMETKTVPHSKLRYTGEEFAARVERAQDLAKKAEKPPKTPAARAASRPVTLSPHLVPHDWAIEHGYNVGGLHWKSENTEAMIYHFLTGKRPREKFPKGTPGHEQWSYKGGKNKAEREAIIRKITAALDARDEERWDDYARLLEEACLLVAEFGPLDLEESAAVATLQRWDPLQHPRGRGGMFRDVLTMLRSNGSYNLGHGVTVQRTTLGFRTRGSRGGGKFHFDETKAVDHAMELHSEAVRKDQIAVHGRPFFAHTRAPGGDKVLDPEWMVARGREREQTAAATGHLFPEPGHREGTRVHLGMGHAYDLKDEATARQVADEARSARRVGGVAQVRVGPGVFSPGGERERRGGVLWEYTDNRGVTKRGYVERTSDRGGTDVTYFFRGEDGKLDVLSGMQVKRGARPLYGLASPGGERAGGEKNARKIERMKGDSIRFGAMTVRREDGGTYSVETNRGESLGTGLSALDASRAVSAHFQGKQRGMTDVKTGEETPLTSEDVLGQFNAAERRNAAARRVLEPGRRGVLSPSYAEGMGSPGGERLDGDALVHNDEVQRWFAQHGDSGEPAEDLAHKIHEEEYRYAYADYGEGEMADWQAETDRRANTAGIVAAINRARAGGPPPLEGPFNYRSGWRGYYDPQAGRYLGMDDIHMPRDFDPDTGTTFGTASPGGERGGEQLRRERRSIIARRDELARAVARLTPQQKEKWNAALAAMSSSLGSVEREMGARGLGLASPGGERRGRSGMPKWTGDRVEGLRKVMSDGAREIDGYLVDLQTANLLLTVYDALSPQNQASFGKVPLDKLVDLAWRSVR